MDSQLAQAGLTWQIGVWNRSSDVYVREIDRRFEPVVDEVIARAQLGTGERVLDLGTGTGAVAARAAHVVGPDGLVVGVDISADMLRAAEQRVAGQGLRRVSFREGRAEALPAEDASFDVVLASLSLMYVIDRAAAARELARVLRPQGRLIAAVWAEPEACDIVLFQQTAGALRGSASRPGRRARRPGGSRAVPARAGRSGHPGSRRARDAGLRLRELRRGLGHAGRCHDGPAPAGATAGSPGGRPRRDVSQRRCASSLPEHHALHRGAARVTVAEAP